MNRDRNLKGSWLDDQFKSFIKGFSSYSETYRDGMKFSYEIQRVGNNLFQLRDDEKYLIIQHPNKLVKEYLNSYFIAEHSRYRRGLYDNHFHLGNLFNDTMQNLALYGESFYALDWEEKQIEKRKYILPSNFRYLGTSAMSISRNEDGSIQGYNQRYSPFAQLPRELPRSFIFRRDEIFYTKYPLNPIHPVKKSMYLLKRLLGFWAFGLNRSESVKNKRLQVVWAKQKRFSEEKRKYALARARVRSNFHYLLDLDDLTITEYYDIFLVVRYKKELNDVRNYFVQQFNEQILTPLAEKNSLRQAPRLELMSFMTNQEIDAYFEEYKSKRITSKEFIEKVVNSD